MTWNNILLKKIYQGHIFKLNSEKGVRRSHYKLGGVEFQINKIL